MKAVKKNVSAWGAPGGSNRLAELTTCNSKRRIVFFVVARGVLSSQSEIKRWDIDVIMGSNPRQCGLVEMCIEISGPNSSLGL